ncbi:hypothetical protein FKV24_002255 [Lysobacter maris]|uniref:Uncharacterized protein n=1 Tax=Marilutibacter maris TaxID=1605891 RepID=A0A508AZW4_9GAMM|nr:hypothetical protein FKV24_002255 [Lysobacter maris]
MVIKRRSRSLRFRDLERYSDNCERVGDVQLVLKADRKKGYSLWVCEADGPCRVLTDRGHQLWFRTVDQALDAVADIPYIDRNLIIDRSSW